MPVAGGLLVAALSSNWTIPVILGWIGTGAVLASILLPHRIVRCIAGGLSILSLSISLLLFAVEFKALFGSLCFSLPFGVAVVLRVIRLVNSVYPP
jgi:hypothetical protein